MRAIVALTLVLFHSTAAFELLPPRAVIRATKHPPLVTAMAPAPAKKVALKDTVNMCTMEFVGSFFLNLAITLNDGGPTLGPLSVVATIILIVKTGAPISGAHYNPNLSLGFHLAGDRTSPSPLLYTVAILSGAVAAHALAYFFLGAAGSLVTAATSAGWLKICLAEFLGSYISCLVVFWVALLSAPLQGLGGPVFCALGFFAPIITFKGISGAIINPGVAVAFWLTGVATGAPQAGKTLLMYVTSELLGGAMAGLTAARIQKLKEA